uniref:Uncharacterized protein n=1 Tax=Anguilla anguilla TaxID=7936 RepID=A0A0E9TXA1_ANGAN
MSTEEKQPI